MHLSILLPHLVLLLAAIEVQHKNLHVIGFHTLKIISFLRLLRTGIIKRCLQDREYRACYKTNFQQPMLIARIASKNNDKSYSNLLYGLTMFSLWLAYAIISVIAIAVHWSNFPYLIPQVYLGIFFAQFVWRDIKKDMRKFFNLLDDVDATTKAMLNPSDPSLHHQKPPI